MNYEQRYNNALKRARIGLHDCNLLDCDNMTRRAAITTIYNLFPELAESEEEMIRKDIISYLRNEKIVKRYISDIEIDKWIAWLEKQGEQTTDKVEPKFKVRDWVILPLGIIAHIDSLNSTDYQVTTTDGEICDFKISKQDNYHLWTITDAKSGDVLASKDGNDILIFKKLDSDTNFSSYYNTRIIEEIGWSNNCFIPATKEQRDLPDHHPHPKHIVKMWWENMCDLLSRSTMKQKLKKEIQKEIEL